MIRTDSPLIRHLARTMGLEAAGIYNRLPLFLMPEESDELLRHERDLLDSAPDTLPLPFEDEILDFPFGTQAMFSSFGVPHTRGRLWVRVRRLSAFRPDAATQLCPTHLDGLDPEAWALLEGWEESTATGGLSVSPDHSLLPLAMPDAGSFESPLHGYPNPRCFDHRLRGGFWCNFAFCRDHDRPTSVRCAGSEMIHSLLCRLTVLSTIYLSSGLGGATTEISYRPIHGSREEKTERLKPWVAPRRSTYIIIDPARSGDYGHPSGIRPASSGHHASPIPHARRGHMRRLSPDRKTWVRPTWVGVREWQYDGKTYKIKTQGGPHD
jgi:hypothetical protein